MKLYRYICIYEYKELMRNGFVEARNPANSFTSRNNSAVSPNKGIFFALKEGKGFYTYMSREDSEVLLELEIPDNDPRIVERCQGYYQDKDNFDYDPDDPAWVNSPLILPEVVLSSYLKEDVKNVIFLLDSKLVRVNAGYVYYEKQSA